MLRRIAMVSLHTSPLAAPGTKKTGGMNVYVREISRELGRREIAVDIFTRADRQDVPRVVVPDRNVRVIHLPAGPPSPMPPDALVTHVGAFRQAVEAFVSSERVRYDVVFSHYWLSGWVAEGLRAAWDVPVAQMFHTLGHMKNRVDPGQTGAEMRLRIATETAIMRWADGLIAATPAEHAQLLWLYRADRRKIMVVPPGVDVARFRPLPMREARARLGLEVDSTLLLFVGRLEPLKGIDVLLKAMALVRERAPSTAEQMRVMVIGGDVDTPTPGAELARMLALRDELELGQQVQFVGAREQDMLPYYYSAAEALIMPSDYESFGMVALEAMACGTPVIASETGGLAFLIQDGLNGYHVPTRSPLALANRIMAIAQNPSGQGEIRRAARATALHYSWHHIADRLLGVFGTIIGRFPKAAGSPP